LPAFGGLFDIVAEVQKAHNLRRLIPQRSGQVGHDIPVKMIQPNNNPTEKPAGKVQDDGEAAMAYADAFVAENPEARPKPPPMPLSEIALTGIYEISKILNAPNRLETALSNVLNVLSSFLQMRHGVISLLADDDVPDITVGIG
jgi:hypothetical protein